MKKSFFILLIIILGIQVTYCQFTDEIILSEKKATGVIPDYLDYIPDSNTPIRTIRVNVHLMLLELTHPDEPGNFTREDDGRGDSDFTGYDWVDDLIYEANKRLSTNRQMLYPLGNTTPVIARKYRFVLNGVFFHRDDYYYDFDHCATSYSENVGEAINVFYQSDYVGAIQSHGHANMSGTRYVCFANKWGKYDYHLTLDGTNVGNWGNSAGLIHEIGHNFSLYHTVMYGGGTCCYYYNGNCDDYCTDTPTREYVIAVDGIDPCQANQWVNPDNSNNIMEYSGYDAITPEQLGRVHWTIENELEDHKSCYFTTSSASITSFTDNKSYIAETVTIPSASNIVVDDYTALYVSCEDFNLNGTLEIEEGSCLQINVAPDCMD